MLHPLPPSPNKPARHRAHLFRQLTWAELDPAYLRQLVTLAREEDLAGAGLRDVPAIPGDVTTLSIAPASQGAAELRARQELTVCGLPLIPFILDTYGPGCSVTPATRDATHAAPGALLATVSGPVPTLLQAERVLLNFLQHLSGVATQTARYVRALGDSPTRLLDTRKTTPGFRMLEKYAVACGGGWNHRLGLFDRVMLKDNHLAAAEATAGARLANAIHAVRRKNPTLAIEAEVDRLDQIPPVLEAGVDVILLDNFSLEDTRQAVSLIGDKAYTEASGGVTLDTLPALGKLGLDFISSGALVHQAPWRDIGMDWL